MKLIYEIIQNLKSQEIRHLRDQFKQATFEHEKVGKLFQLVTRYPEREESFYAQKLYGREPDNTFRVTKSRLKRMLENVILQDKSLTGYSSPSINARLQTRKKLLQGEILLGRCAYEASKNLLYQTISAAKKYDLAEERFQAELLMYRNQTLRTSVREYQKNTEQLLALNQEIAMINEAVILHYHISNLLQHKVLKQEEMINVRRQADRIAEICELTQHPRVQYVHYLTENYYAQEVGEYQKALQYSEKFLDLVKETPSQQAPSRTTAALVQLAKVCIQLQRIDEARVYCQQVLQRHSPEKMNYLVGLELSFRIEYYDQNHDSAIAIIKEAMAHPQIESSKLISSKWHYFNACMLFLQERYREAYHELDHTTALLADKYGMNLTLRVLEIMILFEMGHHDILETKILNMRQFIKRTQQQKTQFRPTMLIQILINWYKSAYDFAKTLDESSDDLAALEAYHRAYPFNTSDFELIRLEHWLTEKGAVADNAAS